mmetsp:Transcript_17779/g.53537  ORF Transcript_17779/g.53537 Transcript_17779/m.53537 type:complete len:803 (+) Transcript_17779:248-2656(+)|eukprot:CAMPEP_0206143822 /NCGR_PEP_ID=MMETSP1473-20131121/21936_1 /ASSEMBLY_ACC=CAM_ASM_001109 /TAXON_ID=1461547 /ORGANISM="Stichococcus sp, Strain RCC1054" /LENGTH=802 /DNA_ID=CAMNT_0053539397 /DNA_START=120 /DNA_END=2528 /DNA_ORIENTATION=+
MAPKEKTDDKKKEKKVSTSADKGVKEKKPKSSDATKEKKPSSKDKPAKDAGKDGKPLKSSKDKDGKKGKDPKKAAAADAELSAGQARQLKAEEKRLKAREAERKATGSYMQDMDLPSSSDSDDEERHHGFVAEENEPTLEDKVKMTDREKKKLNEKTRKQLEQAARLKAEALNETEDDAFDVNFESQGGAAGDVVSATDIKVVNMTVRVKGKLLLENTDVNITAGRRYGLVGPNGMGKSTLLHLIMKRRLPVPAGLDVLLVEQEVVGTEQSAVQAVVSAKGRLMELREEEAELNRRLGDISLDGEPAAPDANGAGGSGATPPEGGDGQAADLDDDEAAARLTEVYDELQEEGHHTAEAEASKILKGLGFDEKMQQRATNSFSGGWRMRISLARALFIEPTVLLLDEPTNHLDLRAVLWLEEYLMRWKKTLVVVSHDRGFLNNVTTDIIHLHDLKLHSYRGNFAQFEEMYEQKRTEVNKAADKYEKQIKAAKRSGNKANQDKVNKNMKQAQSRKKAGRGLDTRDDEGAAEAAAAPRRWTDYTVKFSFPEPTELTPPLMQLNDVSFKYPGREDFGLSHLDIGIDMGSRIAIVGPNGAGKTTLMNLLAGDLEPTHGESRRSQKLRIGRYAQHFVDALQMDDTPVEYLQRKFPESGKKLEDLRAMLGRFGLAGHHHLQPIVKLSGGQKSRVVFTAICLSQPHILLLDEPTNHLDMQSIDALSDALAEFEGGVVIISHDAQLLQHVCDETSEVWVVDDGRVETYDGDFDEFRSELAKEIQAELDEAERVAALRAAERAAAKKAAGKK